MPSASSAPTSRWCSPARSQPRPRSRLLAVARQARSRSGSRSGSRCSASLAAYIPVLIAHGRSFLPPHLVGRGMTLFNIGTMGGMFVAQLVERRADRSVPGAGRRLSARRLSRWCSPRRRLGILARLRRLRDDPPVAAVWRRVTVAGQIKDFRRTPSCILCGAVYLVAARYVICVAYRRPPWAFPP